MLVVVAHVVVPRRLIIDVEVFAGVNVARPQGKWCNVVDATAVVSAKIARALKLKGPALTVSQAKTTNVATDLA